MKKKNLIIAGAIGVLGAYVFKTKVIEKRSISSKALESYLKIVPKTFGKKIDEDTKFLERAYEASSEDYILSERFIEKYHIEKSKDFENTYELLGKNGHDNYTVLYIHGGAYWMNPVSVHWSFTRKIAERINGKIIFPIYPKAPTHSYKDVYDMILPIYKTLLEKNPKEKLIIMGDSAGAGFALAFCEQLKELNIEQPKDIILLSPWLDLTMSNEEITESLQKTDPMLNLRNLKFRGELYAKDLETTSALVSPLYGDITGLGKISVFIGTHDILLADCRKFKEKAEKENVSINYFEYPKMNHDFSILPTIEGKDSISKICEIIFTN